MSKSVDLSSVLEAELVDSLRDIKRSRGSLGKFSLRYFMEAVYGESYTKRVLGDDDRYDVLIEDIELDTETTDGGIRTRVKGDNFSGRKLSKEERIQAQKELEEQEREVERAAVSSWQENYSGVTGKPDNPEQQPSSEQSDTVSKVAQMFSQLTPEERDELIDALRKL